MIQCQKRSISSPAPIWPARRWKRKGSALSSSIVAGEPDFISSSSAPGEVTTKRGRRFILSRTTWRQISGFSPRTVSTSRPSASGNWPRSGMRPKLPIEQGMDAIAQHGAQARPIEPLPEQVLADPSLAPRHVGPRQQVPTQERRQSKSVQPIGLDLRIGNQPRLERMRQHHLIHFLEFFEQIMGQAPVPARFQDRFTRPLQRTEKARIPVPTVPSTLASLSFRPRSSWAQSTLYFLCRSIPT